MATIQEIKYIESLKKKIDTKNQRIKHLDDQKILTAECSEDILTDLKTSFLELQDKILNDAIKGSAGSMWIPVESVQQVFAVSDLESVRDRCVLTLRKHKILSWIKEQKKNNEEK